MMKNASSKFLVTSAFTIASLWGTDMWFPSADASAAAHSSVKTVTSKWMTYNLGKKTVILKLTADANDDNGGFNFNGYSKGAMKVHVPQGWNVRVVFRNDSLSPHSAVVVPYAQRFLETGFTAAFPGAFVPRFEMGVIKGATNSFSFKANRSGTFAIVCGVPDHGVEGMWDELDISSKFKLPSIAAGQ